MRRTLPKLILAFAAVIQLACVYALGAQRHVEGITLPAAIRPIPRQATRRDLIALFGEPTEHSTSGSAETLIWRELLRPRGCRIYLFGLIPVNRDPRLLREVAVTISAGHIQQAVERFPRTESVNTPRDLLEDTPP
jgi:hypothetical protein